MEIEDHDFVPWKPFDDEFTLDNVCGYLVDNDNKWCIKSRIAHRDYEQQEGGPDVHA